MLTRISSSSSSTGASSLPPLLRPSRLAPYLWQLTRGPLTHQPETFKTLLLPLHRHIGLPLPPPLPALPPPLLSPRPVCRYLRKACTALTHPLPLLVRFPLPPPRPLPFFYPSPFAFPPLPDRLHPPPSITVVKLFDHSPPLIPMYFLSHPPLSSLAPPCWFINSKR